MKALISPSTPKARRTTISRKRPRTRETPVIAAKTRRRPREPPSRPPRRCQRLRLAHPGEDRRAARARGRLLRCRPARRGLFLGMPNIKQQKRRVSIAARQRLENLRHRSTAKTLLQAARDGGRGRRQGRRRHGTPGARPLPRPRRARRARSTPTGPPARSPRPRAWSPAPRSLGQSRHDLVAALVTSARHACVFRVEHRCSLR